MFQKQTPTHASQIYWSDYLDDDHWSTGNRNETYTGFTTRDEMRLILLGGVKTGCTLQ